MYFFWAGSLNCSSETSQRLPLLGHCRQHCWGWGAASASSLKCATWTTAGPQQTWWSETGALAVLSL